MDLPTLGFPIIETNPDLCDMVILCYCECENIESIDDTLIEETRRDYLCRDSTCLPQAGLSSLIKKRDFINEVFTNINVKCCLIFL